MEAMKRIILILGSLFLGYAVFAHPADRYFDDDDYDDGDLYGACKSTITRPLIPTSS